MKKWPRNIVEITPPARDARAEDPMATQKISARQLEDALRRTKSGFRKAVRESKPEIEETDPRVEPVDEAPPPPEPIVPDPIITVKPDMPTPLDPFVIATMPEEDEQQPGTPIPRTRNVHVVTPSTSIIPEVPRRSQILLAFVVALLTTVALALGYLFGRMR